ncbi:MAG TPA: mycofactocin-coupled SDR family oxidoreductase [Amycolatopsis sp.]|nr:mycofactocin-coupled SDR family oxidoreductase [Amycolatopsis sp.]
MGRVERKVVLVTGAARGMGRAHALRLAEEGAGLILVDIGAPVDGIEYPMSSEADLAAVAKEVEALGRPVVSRAVDVRDGDALTAFVEEAVDRLGRLDAAVANAGVLTAGTWEQTTARDWRTVVDVNLIGTWNTDRAAIPHLIAAGGGSLVNISSAAGIKGSPLTTPYTASKHGVVGLSLALANELAGRSIRVNTVHPTGVPTGLQAPGLHELLTGEHAGLGAIYQNAMPVEAVETSDVSNAVLYLVSDESRYVTGTQLKVDAGVTIR